MDHRRYEYSTIALLCRAADRNAAQWSPVHERHPSMLVKELYETAGIRTSSHSGRRTIATRLNEKGAGMRTIQKLMGHRHTGTTALYCDVSETTMRKCG
jgi:site-specific recombinase XerD